MTLTDKDVARAELYRDLLKEIKTLEQEIGLDQEWMDRVAGHVEDLKDIRDVKYGEPDQEWMDRVGGFVEDLKDIEDGKYNEPDPKYMEEVAAHVENLRVAESV